MSNPLKIHNGLKQGDSLSTMVFNIVLERITYKQKWHKKERGRF